jgi:nucleoside transporter
VTLERAVAFYEDVKFYTKRALCFGPKEQTPAGGTARHPRRMRVTLQRMPSSVHIRLSVMMFLNYVIWGAWYVTLGTYLTTTLKFSGTEAGLVFGTTALASMVSPFFVGLVADRFFSTEKVLAAVHLIGAVILYLVTTATTFGWVYVLMLLYCLCYFPTIALTNSLTLRHINDAGGQFPLIRVFATIGWIVIGQIVGWMRVEASSTPFLLAAGASIAMSVFCLTLPHTPPLSKGEPVSVRTVLGLDALVMLKRRSYLVFILASILGCIPLTFYFSFANKYLNEIGVQNAAGKMTLGQASEVLAMLAMPFIFRRVTVKAILLGGLLAWSVRYVLLAYGNPDAGMWMFYCAILLHGICFDFFFMTGQLYTDQESPLKLRSTAQGFFTFVTYGVGMFLGSLLSGVALDFFTRTSAGEQTHDWPAFWLTCAAGAFAILLVVALFFRSSARIERRAES